MKYHHILLLCVYLLMASCHASQRANINHQENNLPQEKQSIHQFKVKDITGQEFDFSSLKGKKIIIVNTASRCGLTPQYKDLQSLYDDYKDKDLVIVGFPANNFMMQEPGSNEKIKAFCKSKYNVSFPMMEKISVKGKDIHPIYQFLTQKAKNGVSDSKVSWNFQKYLIDENGFLVKSIRPKIKPNSPEIINWLNT